MTRSAPGAVLRRIVVGFGLLSLLMTVGAAAVAGVVAIGNGPQSDSDRAGWQQVIGLDRAGEDGATYSVPGGKDWEVHPPTHDVAFSDADGSNLVSGTGAANWFGNDCVEDGTPIAAAWAVLATPEEGEVGEVMEKNLDLWARGYATNDRAEVAPMRDREIRKVTLADGSPAVQGSVIIDMAVFPGDCVRQRAQMLVTSVASRDGVTTLVQARYLGLADGLPDGDWRGIWRSLRVGHPE